jgi:Clustered mitochondria
VLPLSCIVKYKGFTALCQTNNAYSDKDCVYGFGSSKQNPFQLNLDINTDLIKIGKRLRLRPHNYDTRATGGQGNEVPLSYNLSVYKNGEISPGDLQFITGKDEMDLVNNNIYIGS